MPQWMSPEEIVKDAGESFDSYLANMNSRKAFVYSGLLEDAARPVRGVLVSTTPSSST